MKYTILIRRFGRCDYNTTYQAMKTLTMARDENSIDQIWFLEHPPVFTLGLAGRREHLIDPGAIPVIQADRGGQVTYHGPGQLVCYLLLDLKRKGLSIKGLVRSMEQAVVEMLESLGLKAELKKGAPGVYVKGSKIAALGVRVRRSCCYHGLALNVNMDTSPFLRIDPCGYPGLHVTQLKEHDLDMTVSRASDILLPRLLQNLGYDEYNIRDHQEVDDISPLTVEILPEQN